MDLRKWRLIKIELYVVQFWSEIILAITLRARSILKSRAYDFRPNCTPLSSITIKTELRLYNYYKISKNV